VRYWRSICLQLRLLRCRSACTVQRRMWPLEMANAVWSHQI
jgi:hypothetical protein